MATWTARRKAGRTVRSSGRRAANSKALDWPARAGFAARGVIYIIVGWIAVQVAFGHSIGLIMFGLFWFCQAKWQRI